MQRIGVTCVICAIAIGAAITADSAPGTPKLQEREGGRGVVRMDGRALRDDRGVFNPLGASLFWLAWGYKFDRTRLEANLRALADMGVDYIRALAVVGPSGGWTDREVDPRWPDYERVIAEATDLAYDRFGLRVQWTIFGGVDRVPSPVDRQKVVDRVAAIIAARPHKVMFVEVANEGWQNGFEGEKGRAEVRELGQRLKASSKVLVALTAPGEQPQALCSLYAGSTADLLTMHFDRNQKGPEGVWGPIGAPISFRLPECPGKVPTAVVNNEPIGPGSSGESESDPARLALAYATTFASGHAAYLLHAGPGVRGGGEADRHLGRRPNFSELTEYPKLRSAFIAGKRYTPPGLANWLRHDLGDAKAPLQGLAAAISRKDLAQAVLASEGQNLFAVLLGLRREVALLSSAARALEVLDPATGDVVIRLSVKAGESFTIRPRPGPHGDGLIIRTGAN